MTKSWESKEKLKAELYEFADKLDDEFLLIQNNIREEFIQRKEKTKERNEEAEEIFNRLNDDICKTLISKKLPFHLRLFTKIVCRGFGIKENGQIIIHFSFRINDRRCFSYIFNAEELRSLPQS